MTNRDTMIGQPRGVSPIRGPDPDLVAFAKFILERRLPVAESTGKEQHKLYANFILDDVLELSSSRADFCDWVIANPDIFVFAECPAELVAVGAPLRLNEDRLRDLLDRAGKGDTKAYMALRRQTAGMLRHDVQMPAELREWAAKAFEDGFPVKGETGRRRRNIAKDGLLYRVAILLVERGLHLTRKANARHKNSACDVLAEAMRQLEKHPMTFDGVHMAIKRGRKKFTIHDF